MFGPTRRFSVTGKTGQISSVRTHTNPSTVARSSANKETAMFGAFGLGSLSGNSSMNVQMSGPLATVGMLSYLVPQQEDMLRQYYRDIYYYDPVCGATVDMLSSFAFSDFSLTGVSQDKLLKYQESMARLNIRSLMPDVSTTYLVDGQFVSSLIFNKKEKLFVDLVIYPIDNCTVEQLPFYSTDPRITVKNTDAMVRFMSSNDPQASIVRRLLPDNLTNVFKSKAFQLDAMTTLYLARRPLPGDEPASFLKRVLPIYLLEKTLYRGTLVEAMKRQRSMLHVQMGDDTHEFTPEEMSETVNQFQLADLDPLGAVIGTRNNVQASELRCIAGSTMIDVQGRGKVQIADLVPHNPELLEAGTSFALKVNVKNAMGYKPTKLWWYQGFQPTNILTFSDGTIVECTDNHVWITLDANGGPVLTLTSNIQPDTVFMKDSAAPGQFTYLTCVKTTGPQQHVYDLTMDDTVGPPVFYANSILSKNSGGDFWKSTDVIDILTPYKLRALGISEAFLSGEATFTNAETALSVFMENLDAYRSFLTYETFTNKVFPIVAIYNNFYKAGKEQNIHSKEAFQYQANNYQDLEIPLVHWHKKLAAKDDENVMDTLEKLEEKGMPIPLRMWAAAGKIDLNAYYRDLQEDEEVQEKIKQFTTGEQMRAGKGGSGSDSEEELGSLLRRLNRPIKRQNMMERDYGETGEISSTTKTGQRKYVLNQKKASKELNAMILKAVATLSDPHVRRSAVNKVRARYGRVPNILGTPGMR